MRGICVWAVVLASLWGGALASAADKPDFSGDWVLDASKSEFGPLPKPEKMVRKIEHKEPSLLLTTTALTSRGEVVNTAKLTTDGKESTNAVRAGEVKTTVTWEGNSLKKSDKLSMQGATISTEETWSLSGDGKTLTSTVHYELPQGPVEGKLVFLKQ